MKKRVIIELDNIDTTELSTAKDITISHEPTMPGYSEGIYDGKVIEVYEPIKTLPTDIKEIRKAIGELTKTGFTAELIKSYILRKYKVPVKSYDIVIEGLVDVLNKMHEQNKINKLKE